MRGQFCLALKGQFYLVHAARTLGMGARDCGSSYERCASHDKSVYAFYKGLSETGILDKFQQTARKWAKEILGALALSVSSSALSSAVVTDLQNKIAALSAQFDGTRTISPPTAANDFITSDRGCCNTVCALASHVVTPKTQSLDLSMVENVVAYTGCLWDEAFESLMQNSGDMRRAYEKARRSVSSGRLGALGNQQPATPHSNIEMKGGGKPSLLPETGNSAGFIVSKASYLMHLKCLPLERPTSKLVDTAGASPPPPSARSSSKSSCSRGGAAACVCELK